MLLFGGTFASAFLSLLAQLLLVRLMPVADYGRLSTVLAATTLLAPVSSFGINWFWVQVFGREGYGALRWIRPSIALLFLSNVLSVALLSAYLLSAGTLSNAWLELTSVVLILLGQCAIEIVSVKYQLEERFAQLSLWQSLMQVGRLVVVALLSRASDTQLPAILAGYSLVGLGLAIFGLLVLRDFKLGRVRLAGHPPASLHVGGATSPGLIATAKLSLPFAVTTICYLVSSQSTILLVAAIIGPESTAIFSAALLIFAAINLVPNIVFTKFLFVRICRWAESDRESFAAILHVSVASMIALGVAVMVALALLAPVVTPLIFGPKYDQVISVLIYMSPAIPCRFVQSAYSAMYVSNENVRLRVRFGGVSAVSSLAINLLFLPAFGLYGAVAAFVVSEALMLALSAWGAGRYIEGIRISATFNPGLLKSAAQRVLGVEATRGSI